MEVDPVRSWILRHRLRLRLVYGPPPEAAGSPELYTGPSEGAAEGAPGPYGRVRRTPQGLEVVPMPRRVGRTKQVG